MDTVRYDQTFAGWTVRAGWRLRDHAADVIRGALGGDADIGRRAMRLLLATAEESAVGAALLTPDDERRGAWLELRNRVEAFRAFEHADHMLGACVDECGIVELTGRAARLGAPLSVWAAEGVGYHATAARLRHPGELRLWRNESVPAWALIPLHAGMGSALAAHVLEPLRRRPAVARLEDALARFVALSSAHADSAHRDVALEGLGFTAGGMYGELQPWLAAHVRISRPGLTPLFWHGVGRAMYFAPTAALPLAETRRRVLEDVVDASHDEGARDNTIAGFAWAATLVNLRDPTVLETLAADAERLDVGCAFARGVQDALEVWRRCSPQDDAPVAFTRHVPRIPRLRNSWSRVMDAAEPRHVRNAGELFMVPPARSMWHG